MGKNDFKHLVSLPTPLKIDEHKRRVSGDRILQVMCNIRDTWNMNVEKW